MHKDSKEIEKAELKKIKEFDKESPVQRYTESESMAASLLNVRQPKSRKSISLRLPHGIYCDVVKLFLKSLLPFGFNKKECIKVKPEHFQRLKIMWSIFPVQVYFLMIAIN